MCVGRKITNKRDVDVLICIPRKINQIIVPNDFVGSLDGAKLDVFSSQSKQL